MGFRGCLLQTQIIVQGQTKRPEAIAFGPFAELQMILALDEAFLEHLLVAEP